MERIIMKHLLTNDYSKPILLSALDLSQHLLDQSFITNLLSSPILNDVCINSPKGTFMSSIYINFFILDMGDVLFENNSDFYKHLHQKIRMHISETNGFLSQKGYFYNFQKLWSADQKQKKYIFFFLSPNKSLAMLDFNLFPNKDILLTHLFELIIHSSFIDKTQQFAALNADTCFGKVFLNPIITPRKNGTTIADLFTYEITFKNSQLDFRLKHAVYSLESTSSISAYDDVCYINTGYHYSKKYDARKHKRLFFDFSNLQKFERTRFYAQLQLYKTISATLDRLHIHYQRTRFTPEFLFNDFPSVKLDLKHINIYISSTERMAYETFMLDTGSVSRISSLCEYLKTAHDINSTVIEDPSLDYIVNHQTDACLFLMFGPSYSDSPTREFVNGDWKPFKSALDVIISRQYLNLTMDNFLHSIRQFDLYSQVKMVNFYSHFYHLPTVVSQGLILNNKIDFTSSSINGSIQLKSKSSEAILSKTLNEIHLKHTLFIQKNISLKTEFSAAPIISKFKKIQIVQCITVEKHKIYAKVTLESDGIINNSHQTFIISNYDILLNADVSHINLPIGVETELKNFNNLIVILISFLSK